jgi:hypothetical protein
MDDAPDVLDNWRCIKRVKGWAHGCPPPSPRRCRPSTARWNVSPGAFPAAPAQVLGSYLEGPYFTPQNKGAHPPELFRELDIAELDTLIARSGKRCGWWRWRRKNRAPYRRFTILNSRVYASCWAIAPPPITNPRRF